MQPVAPVSRVCAGCPAVPFPTACQVMPPSPLPLTALAANTRSLVTPYWPGPPCSYQTTHGTVSFGPAKAMSGSVAWRVTSTFRLGFELLETRSMPVCCQQKPPTAGADCDGLVPTGHVVTPLSSFTG